MIDKTRTTPENGTSDALFEVFGGINEGYAASILDRDPVAIASNGSDGFGSDLEYDGLLMDPDFLDREIIITNGRPVAPTETEEGSTETADQPVSTVEVTVVAPTAEVSVDQIVRVERLISAIGEDGHQAADIDPLKMLPRTEEHLSPERFGVLPETLAASTHLLAEAHDEMRPWLAKPTIGDAIAELKSYYCDTIGYEFDHIHSVEERTWLQTRSKISRSCSS